MCLFKLRSIKDMVQRLKIRRNYNGRLDTTMVQYVGVENIMDTYVKQTIILEDGTIFRSPL